MKIFLPLLPVLRALQPIVQPTLKLEPPRTPFPPRKHLESGSRPTPTPTVTRPPVRAPDFDYDDDEGKENNPPEVPPSDDDEESVLRHLLTRWGEELRQYREKVLRDFDDWKRKLETRF
uniref:E4 protein n=1 Tax=Human papillomavirus TaxID=10566 RepID=A0A385PKI1_9PAPI|nr:MAG: E4 protein [Human papillomavirus]